MISGQKDRDNKHISECLEKGLGGTLLSPRRLLIPWFYKRPIASTQ